MSNPSKVKGDGFEREVVAKLAEHGIHAIKMPYSGALNNWKGDIELPVRGSMRKLECKRRKRSYSTIYGDLGVNYGLVMRDDKCPALVVLRLEDFAQLARLVL